MVQNKKHMLKQTGTHNSDAYIEKCIICGNETNYTQDTPVMLRRFYIIGCGQMCQYCYNDVYGID